MPRPLPAFAPHPVTGGYPTREDFPVDRATTDSIARLRAIAVGTHRPDAHWPAHATDAYLAKKRRPSPFLCTLRRIRHTTPKASTMRALITTVLTCTLATGLLLTGLF